VSDTGRKPFGTGHIQDIEAHNVVHVGRDELTSEKADTIARTLATGLRRALRDQQVSRYSEVNADVSTRWPGWVAVRPLRSKADYNEAMDALDRLIVTDETGTDGDLFVVLAALVAAPRLLDLR
jgi:hypothetical protein